MGNLLKVSEEKLRSARDTISAMIERREESGRLLNEALELELIIRWSDAVEHLKQDLFQDDLEDRREEEEQDLFNEIEEIIKGGEVEEISEPLKNLKETTQNYEMLPDVQFKLYDIIFKGQQDDGFHHLLDL